MALHSRRHSFRFIVNHGLVLSPRFPRVRKLAFCPREGYRSLPTGGTRIAWREQVYDMGGRQVDDFRMETLVPLLGMCCDICRQKTSTNLGQIYFGISAPFSSLSLFTPSITAGLGVCIPL